MLLGPMDIWRWEMNLVKSYRSIFWVSSYSVGDCLSEFFVCLPYLCYFEVDRISRILENNPLLLIERVSADRVLANFWAPAVSGTGVQLGGKRNSSRLWPKVRGTTTRSIHTGLGAKYSPFNPPFSPGGCKSHKLKACNTDMSPCYMRKRLFRQFGLSQFRRFPPGGEVAREAATLGTWHECWYFWWKKSRVTSWCGRYPSIHWVLYIPVVYFSEPSTVDHISWLKKDSTTGTG